MRSDSGFRAEADERDCDVSSKDKAKNTAESGLGKAKEGLGKATDDEKLEAEGQVDQSKADLKQAGEKVKDAFND
jgi:uncharacterized protein YjbJ (UPF0337 family)